MKKFFVYKITKKITLEIEFLQKNTSVGWFPIFNHSLDVKFKGSQKGFYWSILILGIKLFEIDIYKNTQQ